MINFLSDAVIRGGQPASVMEMEKRNTSRPSDNYKPLVERLTSGDSSDSSSSFSDYVDDNYNCINKEDDDDDDSFDDGLSG